MYVFQVIMFISFVLCIILLAYAGTQSRYLVQEFPPSGALLRIEPVRVGRDDANYECVAENGVGDAVSAVATLVVFESE